MCQNPSCSDPDCTDTNPWCWVCNSHTTEVSWALHWDRHQQQPAPPPAKDPK